MSPMKIYKNDITFSTTYYSLQLFIEIIFPSIFFEKWRKLAQKWNTPIEWKYKQRLKEHTEASSIVRNNLL